MTDDKKGPKGPFFLLRFFFAPSAIDRKCSTQRDPTSVLPAFADTNSVMSANTATSRSHHRSRLPMLALALPLLLSLAGCDIPGLGPDPRIAQRDAEARAVGGACRYALRGIEDCYRLNDKASKAQVFAGWKDMDQYMRDNKVNGIPANLAQASPPSPTAASGAEADTEASIDQASEKLIAGSRTRRSARAAPL